MSACNDKVPVWRVFVMFFLCIAIYLYLYTNVFDGMNTSSVYRVVEGDLQIIPESHATMLHNKAVWKDKLGSISYYLKLMEQSDKSLKIELSATEKEAATSPPAAPAPTKQDSNVTGLLKEVSVEIQSNSTLPLVTLFTSWSESRDKYLMHNLTVKNWQALRPFVIPVIFTNESSVREECIRLGWEVLPISVAAAGDIPVLKYMYSDVMKTYNSTFYAYSNGDILFTDSLLSTLLSLTNSSNVNLTNPTLIVGHRTNVANVSAYDGGSWGNITHIAKTRGKVFTGWAEDFFITSRTFPWPDMAEVVIGRRAYDNWLVYNARKSKYTVIDATQTMLAVHQTDKGGNFEGHGHKNRDYNHNLLVKLYKRIKYNAGVLECIEKYTKYENGLFTIKSRTLPKNCSV